MIPDEIDKVERMIVSILQLVVEPIMTRLDSRYVKACHDILVEAGQNIHVDFKNDDFVALLVYSGMPPCSCLTMVFGRGTSC